MVSVCEPKCLLTRSLCICSAYFWFSRNSLPWVIGPNFLPSRAVVEDPWAQRGFRVFEGQPDVPKAYVGVPGHAEAAGGAHEEDSNARRRLLPGAVRRGLIPYSRTLIWHSVVHSWFGRFLVHRIFSWSVIPLVPCVLRVLSSHVFWAPVYTFGISLALLQCKGGAFRIVCFSRRLSQRSRNCRTPQRNGRPRVNLGRFSNLVQEG